MRTFSAVIIDVEIEKSIVKQ